MRWITFIIVSPVSHTRVHFFPATKTGSGILSVNCSLRVFGNGVEEKTVQLEGLKMQQPDGLDLQDAFPHLKEASGGIYGLEISLAPATGKNSLESSFCVIEILSGERSTKFYPRAIQESGEKQTKSATVLENTSLSCSVVAVNGSTSSYSPCTITEGIQKTDTKDQLRIPALGSSSIWEAETNTKESNPQSSWKQMPGSISTKQVSIEDVPGAATGSFLVFRDSRTRQINSVKAI